MLIFLSLMAATFVSEDLTTIGAGLLVERGAIGLAPAILACLLGIFAGDLALWAAGRSSLRLPLVRRLVTRARTAEGGARAAAWLQRNATRAILASRFLPGSRLPLYVTAGIVGVPVSVFGGAVLVAGLLWVPALVWLSAALGDRAAAYLERFVGSAWTFAALVVAAVLAIRGVQRAAASASYGAMAARLARLRRWEFWPMWLFYSPVAAWVGLLSIRYGGLSTVTAANPGIADGGTVGESKYDITRRLPCDSVIPTLLLTPGELSSRLAALLAHMATVGWRFPIVLKPDVGQRGTDVKLVRDERAAAAYFRRVTAAVIAQPYDPGPFEAGVFYYRMPGETHGRILSITDKQFPVLVGDGRSSVEELVLRHPRFRLQAATFLRRHRDEAGRVLAEGERFQLALAGNHAQGTLFRDGRHLITPALERRIDDIARACPGFYVGRFDIRYRSVEAFTAGRGLAIVELNGATAESTNIYDPETRLVDAYRQLFVQWSIVFAIGAANRAAGAAVTPFARLVKLIRAHLARRSAFQVSD